MEGAVSARWELTDLFVSEKATSDDAAGRLVGLAGALGTTIHTVADNVVDAISETDTPQGVVAVVRAPTKTIEEIPEGADLVLVLGEVRDPGNAGTLLRSAVAAGADAVVFSTGSVDPFNGKTVRSAAGATFRTLVIRDVTLNEALATLRARGFKLVAADAQASTPVDDVDFSGAAALVLGNESWGLPDPVARLLDVSVGIPMPGPVESLNVAVAGSILLFDIIRRRRQTPRLSSE